MLIPGRQKGGAEDENALFQVTPSKTQVVGLYLDVIPKPHRWEVTGSWCVIRDYPSDWFSMVLSAGDEFTEEGSGSTTLIVDGTNQQACMLNGVESERRRESGCSLPAMLPCLGTSPLWTEISENHELQYISLSLPPECWIVCPSNEK